MAQLLGSQGVGRVGIEGSGAFGRAVAAYLAAQTRLDLREVPTCQGAGRRPDADPHRGPHNDAARERQFRRLAAEGRTTALARGLYSKSDDLGDENLIEIAAKSPHVTLSMRSALARHGLIDDIPAEIDVAIPRGSWSPQVTAPVRWRHFDPDTFEVGRDRFDIGNGCGTSTAPTWRMRHSSVGRAAEDSPRGCCVWRRASRGSSPT